MHKGKKLCNFGVAIDLTWVTLIMPVPGDIETWRSHKLMKTTYIDTHTDVIITQVHFYRKSIRI